MTQEIPPDTQSRARSLFGELIQGHWEKARREFDAGVRHADADQIARGWTKVTHPGGSFKGMGAPAARRSGGYTVVSVPLTFQTGDATGRVVLGRDGKVTGLTLEYPRRCRLDPRRVHVLAVGNRDPEVAKALHTPARARGREADLHRFSVAAADLATYANGACRNTHGTLA
jgi:hypothetical protein